MKRSPESWSIVVGTLLLLSPSWAAPQNPAAAAVRYWTLNDATRVVIETTGEFTFTSDRAKNPDRIFFDVRGARVRQGTAKVQTVSVGDRMLRQVRIAETQPGVTRVVFDLDSAVEYSASQLTNPSRLIVELRPGLVPLPLLTAEKSTPGKLTTGKMSVEKPAAPAPVAATIPVSQAPERSSTTTTVATVRMPDPPALPASTPKVEKVPDPTRGNDRIPVLKPPRAATLGGGSSSMTRVLGLKIGRIVLDAGHGGHDTGTAGPTGLLEKDLVLDVTKRLGALIETRLGAEVVYTRSDDTFIPLETRPQIANEHRADLFLSVHANSSPAPNSSGVETYYLNFTTSQASMEVAARENASSQKTVYDLKDLLQRIALQDKVDESREFAASVQQSLYGASARAIGRTRNRGVKKAPFVVLIGASMPSVLAEIGFISNPKDEALLKKADVRQKIAEGLYKGLAQYAGTLSQFQVASN